MVIPPAQDRLDAPRSIRVLLQASSVVNCTSNANPTRRLFNPSIAEFMALFTERSLSELRLLCGLYAHVAYD
jgi:hypothetical protein